MTRTFTAIVSSFAIVALAAASIHAEEPAGRDSASTEGTPPKSLGQSYRGPLPPADEPLLSLAAELRKHVHRLTEEIGERNVREHPQELARAADWIEAELTGFGYQVRRIEYEVSGGTCANIEAQLLGAAAPREIVVIGAHYDSAIGTPGANDNGSGVAAMLALARRFARQKTDRTLRFVAFTNEEPPYFQQPEMGSWVYAKECRKQGDKVTAMLSLETIGYYDDRPGSQNYPAFFKLLYPSTGNFIAFVGNLPSADLLQQVVSTFRQHEQFPSEGGVFPEVVPGVGFSDQ